MSFLRLWTFFLFSPLYILSEGQNWIQLMNFTELEVKKAFFSIFSFFLHNRWVGKDRLILLTRLLQLLTSFLRNLPLVSFREIHPPLVSTTRPLSVVFVIRAPPSRWMFRPLTSSLRTELFTDDLKFHRQLASILVVDAVEKTQQ